MMYAVQYDADSYGPAGCPDWDDGRKSYGCPGSVENQIGTWEMNSNLDFKLGGCDSVVTHSHAALKKFKEKFTWMPPEDSGLGDVIFRVLLKHGSTNGGMFYWPMLEDLVVTEGAPSTVVESEVWYSGDVSKS